MVEQRYQAIVERVNSLLALTRTLAREETHRGPGRAPDLEQLKNEAAQLTADIDAARHDLSATGPLERPHRSTPTGYWFG